MDNYTEAALFLASETYRIPMDTLLSNRDLVVKCFALNTDAILELVRITYNK